jgi:hypothetical protein
MAESPEEKEALEKLDEETREVSWGEFQKEADREVSTGPLFGSRRLGWRFGLFRPFRRAKGDPVPEPVDDEDPADDRSMRDVMHEDDAKNSSQNEARAV